MSKGHTSYKCDKQVGRVTQQLLCVAGSPVSNAPPPLLAWRALERGYVAGTFDYIMINYSNTS